MNKDSQIFNQLKEITTNTLELSIDSNINMSKIESGKLTWLPWIGENYPNTSKKLLIVGESHYYNPIDNTSFEKHKNQEFTRININELGIQKAYKRNKNYNVKIMANFHYTLFKTDDSDTTGFWQNSAYMNLIQYPMKTNSGRPTKKQFRDAWPALFTAIKIIKPDQVLFIGNSCADEFNRSAKGISIEFENMQRVGNKIGGAFAKRAFLKIEDKKIQLDFIRHTSQHFSWQDWNKYLMFEGVIQPFINSK